MRNVCAAEMLRPLPVLSPELLNVKKDFLSGENEIKSKLIFSLRTAATFLSMLQSKNLGYLGWLKVKSYILLNIDCSKLCAMLHVNPNFQKIRAGYGALSRTAPESAVIVT